MVTFLLAVTLSWIAPTERENGDELTAEEIGGYEIKVNCGGNIEHFNTENLIYQFEEFENCEFYLAVFDTNGVYSVFVKAEPIDLLPAPPPPMRGGIR